MVDNIQDLFSPTHDMHSYAERGNERKSWLAFARQKITELAILKQALVTGYPAVSHELEHARTVIRSHREAPSPAEVRYAIVSTRLMSV